MKKRSRWSYEPLAGYEGPGVKRPDTNLYEVNGHNGTKLCAPCARKLRTTGCRVEILKSAVGRCEICPTVESGEAK